VEFYKEINDRYLEGYQEYLTEQALRSAPGDPLAAPGLDMAFHLTEVQSSIQEWTRLQTENVRLQTEMLECEEQLNAESS
jgi:hypothetical protein